MRKFILVFLLACEPADYARALDDCALSHRHDPQGRAACQCAAARDAGRSFQCDGGAQ